MRLTEGLPHANLLSAKRAWLYSSVNALAKISVATRRTPGDPSLKRGERTRASSQHRRRGTRMLLARQWRRPDGQATGERPSTGFRRRPVDATALVFAG